MSVLKAFPKEKETDIVRSILDYLKIRRILAWRMPVQGVMQSGGGKVRFKPSPIAGFPDIAGLYGGVLFCFEVKRSNGRVSEKQSVWIRQLREHGAHASVVRSVADVEAVLREIDGSRIQ